MTTLTIRKLQVDLSQGFDRHWHGGDAFRSQYYNALSMSFPVGEQSFIDAVREGLALLPDTPEHAALRADVAQFIGQEATHRHVHGLYNEQLEKQGLVNRWQDRATRRIEYGRAQKVGPLHLLAITAAFEHCTAVFADGTLRYGSWFDAAEPRMCTLWRWHAAEETEHRAVAFNLYQALGGNFRWRIRWYLYVLALFAMDATRQTILNLWRDGSLFKPGTWWGAATFLLGKDGMVWRSTRPLLQYFRHDFHPNHEYLQPAAQTLAGEWLKAHAGSYRVVR
ncbi:MAG: metal-dependent hydrolase [Rhodoferax sp.]|nr:metal-dependent hydrolase [Rhodoferax sp.]